MLNSVLAKRLDTFRDKSVIRSSGSTTSLDLDALVSPAQLRFLRDTTKRKAALCTRRAGKTTACAYDLVSLCLSTPKANALYVAPTRAMADAIFMSKLIDITEQHNIANVVNQQKLTMSFSNGSKIYLFGGDANKDQQKKLQGNHYHRAVIDEAGMFRSSLKEMINEMILPALSEHNGQMILIGTPQNNRNYFYDITTGKASGWSINKWSWKDNIYQAHNIQNDLDVILKDSPEFVLTSGYKQHWLGEWSIEESALVYPKYGEHNHILELPPNEYTYYLGVDLGFNDASAFVVGAVPKYNDKTLYIVSAFKKSEMDLTDVANVIRTYQQQYDIRKVVVDGANKQGLAEIRNRHLPSLAIVPAEKTSKLEYIYALNDDLIQQRIKLILSATDALTSEYATLVYDARDPLKQTEDPSCENHACDAALYLWRECRTHLVPNASPPKPKTGTVEAYNDRKEREWKKMQKLNKRYR